MTYDLKKPLSDREQSLLDFIIRFKTDNDGIGPTIQQMVDETDITSKSVVVYYLLRLEERGLIERDICTPRMIRVPGYEWRKQT